MIRKCQHPHLHVLLDSLSTCFLLFLLNVSHISWKEKLFICISCSENVIYIFLEHRAYFRKSLKACVDPKNVVVVVLENKKAGFHGEEVLWRLYLPTCIVSPEQPSRDLHLVRCLVWGNTRIHNKRARTLHWCTAVWRICPHTVCLPVLNMLLPLSISFLAARLVFLRLMCFSGFMLCPLELPVNMLRKGDGGLPSAWFTLPLQEEGSAVYWDEQQLYLGPPFFFRSGGVYLSLSASWCVRVGVPVCAFVPTPPPPPCFVVALTGLYSHLHSSVTGAGCCVPPRLQH